MFYVVKMDADDDGDDSCKWPASCYSFHIPLRVGG